MSKRVYAMLARGIGFTLLLLLTGIAHAQPSLTLLTTLGRGRFYDAVWSPDGTTLAVAGSLGTWLYSVADLNAEPHLLEGELGGMSRVAYSPDGSQLAAASPYDSHDGSVTPSQIILWDVASGTKIRSLSVAMIPEDVAFSPDGKWLAVCGSEGAQLWDTATGELRYTFPAEVELWQIAFSSDSRYVTFADNDGSLRVWDTATGKQVVRLLPEGETIPTPLHGVVFSPDGHFLVSSDSNGTLRVWQGSAVDWRLTGTYQTGELISDLTFSPDGTRLAGAAYGKNVLLWTFHEGVVSSRSDALHAPDVLPMASFQRVMFSPDGTQLVVAGNEGVVRVWSVESKQLSTTLTGSVKQAAVFSPKTSRLAVSRGQDVEVWDFASGQGVLMGGFSGPALGIGGMAYSPDETQFVAGSMEKYAYEMGGALYWWATPLGTPSAIWFTRERYNYGNPGKVVFRPDGAVLGFAFSLDNGSCMRYGTVLSLWDTTTGKRLPTPQMPGYLNDFAFSPDSRLLAASFTDSVCVATSSIVKIWDTATNSERASLISKDKYVSHLMFSPDGATLFGTGYDDGTRENLIYRWDTRDLHELSVYRLNAFTLYSLALSPNGKTLALGDDHGRVQLVDAGTGSVRLAMNAHLNTITGLTFSADGRLLATTSTDGTVRVWQVG